MWQLIINLFCSFKVCWNIGKAWPESLVIGEVQQLPQHSLASNTAVPSSPQVYIWGVCREAKLWQSNEYVRVFGSWLQVFSSTCFKCAMCVCANSTSKNVWVWYLWWARYRSITDQQLDVIASDVQHELPVGSYRQMLGYLRTCYGTYCSAKPC